MDGEPGAWGGAPEDDDDRGRPGGWRRRRNGGRRDRAHDDGADARRGAEGADGAGGGIDVDALVLQLLDIAADPERPMPHRHMAFAEVRDLRAGRRDPHVAADLARLWRHATMDPDTEAETRRVVPSFWTRPVLPPSAEVRRMQRHRLAGRCLAAVCGTGGVCAATVSAWWMLTH